MFIKKRAVSMAVAMAAFTTLVPLAACANELASSPKQFNAIIGANSSQLDNQPITVMADVHGDFATMLQLLQQANIVNKDGNWSAGNRILISLGDLVDRGPDSRQILDFFMQLEQQAAQAGGAFLMVLGNHEVMNIRGDLRYVSEAEFAAFANDEPAGLRDEVYKDYLLYSKLDDNEESLAKFNKLYPPGFFGHVKAYAPDGKYGRWLLGKNIMLRQDGKLFAHGGFSHELPKTGQSLEQINQQLMLELEEYSRLWRELIDAGLFKYYFSKHDQKEVAQALVDGKIQSRALKKRSTIKKAQKFVKLADSLLFDSFGPTWYRGNMYCHEFSEELTINSVLNYFGANQIFLGHTPDNSLKVRSRFGGKVIMLDTGMSQSYYKGNPSVVNLTANGLQVLNINDANNKQPLVDAVRKPISPNGFSDDYLRDYYQKAKVTAEKELGDFYTNPIRLTFDLDGKQHRAIFKYLDTDQNLEDKRWNKVGNFADRFIYDLAAFELDRLLGLNMVPFVMEYKHDGKTGILQYWVEDSVSKSELIMEKRALDGYCTQSAARDLMQIFDWLIFNEDRNTGNELYTEDDAQLWLIDHTRAFRVKNSLPKYDTEVFERLTPPQTISPSYKERLLSLNSDNLKQALGKYLHRKQIDSILKRRDLILERLD
ncbi:MAG: metallophosphoesterase [Gammaproteobacteria bacterium]|nr:metallophosphoesterase [Gammaproteobacteria bacterium]